MDLTSQANWSNYLENFVRDYDAFIICRQCQYCIGMHWLKSEGCTQCMQPDEDGEMFHFFQKKEEKEELFQTICPGCGRTHYLRLYELVTCNCDKYILMRGKL